MPTADQWLACVRELLRVAFPGGAKDDLACVRRARELVAEADAAPRSPGPAPRRGTGGFFCDGCDELTEGPVPPPVTVTWQTGPAYVCPECRAHDELRRKIAAYKLRRAEADRLGYPFNESPPSVEGPDGGILTCVPGL